MITLLKIEWLKLKNYTVFKLLSIFFIAGIVLTNYIVYVVNKNMLHRSSAGVMLGSFNPYNFETTWQTTSYATGCMLLLPAMLIIILITNEYTYKTHRQNIIDGWSRSEFINVKLVLALLIAIATTIVVFLTALGFGLLSGTDFSFYGFSHIGFFLLKAVSYNMFAVLIAVLLKRTGFAIGLYFIYLVLENLLSAFLDYVSNSLKDAYGTTLGSLGDYLPLSSSDGLLTFPDNPLKSIAKTALPAEFVYIIAAFAVGWLALFIWWSRKRFIRSDL